jgi:H+/Cl- antiporter ClcA
MDLIFYHNDSTGSPYVQLVGLQRCGNVKLSIVCCFQCRYFVAFLAYGGCNLVLGATAAAICAYIAPAAAGSGIPEVKAYLNGVDAYSILAPSTLFVKVSLNPE